MGEPDRILILRRKAIGDVVVSLAVARALRQRWPHCRLDLLVDRFAAPVVAHAKVIDELLIYDRHLHSKGSPVHRARAAQRWLQKIRARKYDVVLDLMGTPQTALWTRASGAAVRVGRRRRLRSWAYNRVLPAVDGSARFAGDVFLDWVRALEHDAPNWIPVPLIDPGELDAPARPESRCTGPWIVLNPSATWSAKAWPWAHFARLARLLHERFDALVEIAWGPGEEAARDSIIEAAHGAARAMPPTDLPQLIRRLSAVELLITTDSGPKHMAVAQGTPTLTLFGSTNPQGWQPPTPGHAWVTHAVDCHPCDLTECTVPGHPCLDDLQPEQVLEEAARMLANAPQGEAR